MHQSLFEILFGVIKNETHSPSTKARLLAAARTVFAAHGAHASTTRMICAQAKANAAAVSYHFGGKDRLFAAVMEDHMVQAETRFPLDAGVTPSSPPQERLRAFVRGLLSRLLGNGDEEYDRVGKLLTAEMLDPSPHFQGVMDRHMQPCHLLLEAMVRELLPQADPETVGRCAASIEGQCLLFHTANSLLWRVRHQGALHAQGLDRTADFIVEVSLGGLGRLGGQKH